jgi:hypothetical protein
MKTQFNIFINGENVKFASPETDNKNQGVRIQKNRVIGSWPLVVGGGLPGAF